MARIFLQVSSVRKHSLNISIIFRVRWLVSKIIRMLIFLSISVSCRRFFVSFRDKTAKLSRANVGVAPEIEPATFCLLGWSSELATRCWLNDFPWVIFFRTCKNKTFRNLNICNNYVNTKPLWVWWGRSIRQILYFLIFSGSKLCFCVIYTFTKCFKVVSWIVHGMSINSFYHSSKIC